jgi:hypothetical protein
MTSGEPDIGEKAISKIAEVVISSQLDGAEDLNVDIRADPLKVVQGQVDSVEIEGKGIVVQQDLRVEALKVSTDSVAIDPLSLLFDGIELTHPTSAETRIVLTEADLNRALSSEYLRPKLQDLKMQVQGKPVTIDLQRGEIQLPDHEKLLLNVEFLVQETGERKHFTGTVVPKLQQDAQRISLEILSAEGQGLTSELVYALLEQLTNLLDLSNFEIPGISLQLREFDVQPGQMVLFANTIIEEITSD